MSSNSPTLETEDFEKYQDPKQHTDDDDDSNVDQEDADDGNSELDRYWPPPILNNVELAGSNSSKTVSALTFNNSGTRFAAGGHDHEIRVWDFEALDLHRPEAICSSQPCGQTVIKNLDFSHDDELILVVSGSSQAVIVAKDGSTVNQHQCPKGDQYISDMTNTKGHVQMLNDGSWNPKDNGTFITCSNDATIRVWDLNKTVQQKAVIKTRSPVNGLKAVPNICKYSRDALSIFTGCNDGSIMFWDTRRKFISTSGCIKNAHFKGSEVTGIDFFYGLNRICTRSEDESCKVWDLRKLRDPLASKTGLATLYSITDCSLSPDDKFVITGTSKTKQDSGQLLFLDSNDLSTKDSVEAIDSSVIRCKWHPKINHIAYSCSNGSLFVAYDKNRSLGGFLATQESASKGVKRRKYTSQRYTSASINRIITPHALPLFREDHSKTSFAKIRQDPKRSYKPEMPVTGASLGGRVKPSGSTLSSYIAKNIAKPVDDCGLNIRERLLRHADETDRAEQSGKGES